MEYPINQRVKIIVDEVYKGKARQFSQKLGHKRETTVYNIIAQRHQIGSDVIDDILRAHPDISAEWLLRGEGPMTKDKDSFPSDYDEVKAKNEELRNLLEQVTAELLRLNRALRERKSE